MAWLNKEKNGFVLQVDKRYLKEATCRAMEEMRYLARANQTNEMFGIATTLYEW
jgi:hypothetical protein